MKKHLEQLDKKLSKREKILIYILCIAAVFGGYYYFLTDAEAKEDTGDGNSQIIALSEEPKSEKEIEARVDELKQLFEPDWNLREERTYVEGDESVTMLRFEGDRGTPLPEGLERFPIDVMETALGDKTELHIYLRYPHESLKEKYYGELPETDVGDIGQSKVESKSKNNESKTDATGETSKTEASKSSERRISTASTAKRGTTSGTGTLKPSIGTRRSSVRSSGSSSSGSNSSKQVVKSPTTSQPVKTTPPAQTKPSVKKETPAKEPETPTPVPQPKKEEPAPETKSEPEVKNPEVPKKDERTEAVFLPPEQNAVTYDFGKLGPQIVAEGEINAAGTVLNNGNTYRVTYFREVAQGGDFLDIDFSQGIIHDAWEIPVEQSGNGTLFGKFITSGGEIYHLQGTIDERGMYRLNSRPGEALVGFFYVPGNDVGGQLVIGAPVAIHD